MLFLIILKKKDRSYRGLLIEETISLNGKFILYTFGKLYALEIIPSVDKSNGMYSYQYMYLFFFHLVRRLRKSLISFFVGSLSIIWYVLISESIRFIF